MFCRLGFFSINRLQKIKLSSHFSRQLNYKPLNQILNGSFIAHLKNDRLADETKEAYTNRSWIDLKNNLQKNTFYMYVSKAFFIGETIYPGHIASFFTNDEGSIVSDSFVSLRRGERIPNKILTGTLEHDSRQVYRSNLVWKAKFVDIETEFNKHYFYNAPSNNKSKADEKSRFLIGIPIDKIDFKENISNTKMTLQGKDYILFKGKIDEEEVKSLNCITGFYEALMIIGTEPNPSPQMAAWSYLKLVLGLENREKLIKGTDFREPGLERAHDDQLSYRKAS